MPDALFAEIALGLPIDKCFHYRIPSGLVEEIAPGKRVWVPFRNNEKVGYVVGVTETPEVKDPKPIRAVIDKEPVLDAEFLTLTKKIADYAKVSLR